MSDPVIHEVSALFPAMDDAEFRELVEDIRRHGLREPIWRYEGAIIDGRHRYRACQELGIEPTFREWAGDGSLVAFVTSLNLRRRHLSQTQKAAIAADMLPLLEAEARERQRRGVSETFHEGGEGRSDMQAGRAVGVNHHYVSDAKRVKDRAPDVFELMREDRVTVPEAKALVELPEPARQVVIAQAREAPERKVTTLVREAKREQRRQDVETSERYLAIAHGARDGVDPKDLIDECMRKIFDLDESIEAFDPHLYAPLLDPGKKKHVAYKLRKIRNWLELFESEMQPRIRSLKKDDDDAHLG